MNDMESKKEKCSTVIVADLDLDHETKKMVKVAGRCKKNGNAASSYSYVHSSTLLLHSGVQEEIVALAGTSR